MREKTRRLGVEESDHRHRRLLRLGGERRKSEAESENDREPDQPHAAGESSRAPRRAPARRRTSTRYSMTWSARPSTEGGIVSPSAFAVFRLMTNSNLVGCSTGRSAGLAPLRILST